jgi:putative transposase
MGGTKTCMSPTYHQITYGETERTNKSLEDMLRMYVGKRQQSWDKWSYLIQFAYDQWDHSSIGVSPFRALYGQECGTSISLATPNSKN